MPTLRFKPLHSNPKRERGSNSQGSLAYASGYDEDASPALLQLGRLAEGRLVVELVVEGF